MFKPGEKIIWIHDKLTTPGSTKIKENEIYTFNKYHNDRNILINIIGHNKTCDFYDECRFISLKEYRKIKLKKIDDYGVGE